MKWKKFITRLFNVYPPFLGAGIRIHVSKDNKKVNVSMKLYFWNRNYVGTHYGGSIYSMCDPWFMFLLLENLGPGFIIWDKSARIEFKNPGRGKLHAVFFIPEQRYCTIREELMGKDIIHPVFTVDVVADSGIVVATTEKTIYIRKKKTNSYAGNEIPV